MGLFNKLFSASLEQTKTKELPWISLKDMVQLKDIEENSKIKPQVIFKHSTRCGISSIVMNQLIESYELTENDVDLYYLDLLNYRDVSNEIGYKFQVLHESPQLLVVKNGIQGFHDAGNLRPGFAARQHRGLEVRGRHFCGRLAPGFAGCVIGFDQRLPRILVHALRRPAALDSQFLVDGGDHPRHRLDQYGPLRFHGGADLGAFDHRVGDRAAQFVGDAGRIGDHLAELLLRHRVAQRLDPDVDRLVALGQVFLYLGA